LNLKEARSYAKSEFGFEVSEDVFSRCLKQISDARSRNGGKAPALAGIPFESFHVLKVAVGIAREVARDRKRQSEKKERLESLRLAVAEVEALVDKTEASSQNTKEVLEKLQNLEDEKSVNELLTACEEAASVMASVEDEFETARGKVEELGKGDASGALEEHRNESTRLSAKLQPFKLALANSKFLVDKLKEKFESRRTAEVQALGVRAASVLRAASPKALGSGDEILDGLGGLDGEPLGKDELTNFLRTRWEDPQPAEDLVLRWLDSISTSEKPTHLQRFDIWRSLRQCWKVMKPTTLTDGLSVKESTTLQKLEAGEVVELIGQEEPLQDEESELQRIRARLPGDGTVGYVTVKSNSGSITLLQGGDRLKVVKETSLAESLEVSGPAAKEPLRQLKVGEILEYLDEEKKDEVSGLLRVKVRAQNDKACGWASKVGNQGTVFLQQL